MTANKSRFFSIAFKDEGKDKGKGKPPLLSARIGIERDFISMYSSVKKPIIDKKPKLIRKGIHCPNLPTQWRNNFIINNSRMEFGTYAY